MLFTNDEIIFLNCIYKINRYKISLYVMIDITCLNIFFYFDIYLLQNEKLKNYQ